MYSVEKPTRSVTAISSQKRNRERVNIFLDGEYAFSLSRIVAAKLQIGQLLSQTTIDGLLSEDSVESAKQRAFRFVSYRPRSVWEMKQYLIRKGYEESTIESVIERLQELKMLDDREFAQYWVEQRETFKPRSRRALQHELFKLGIERKLIEEVVDKVDETVAAHRAATKKMNIWGKYSRKDFREKMIPYLQRRGFNYATADKATTDLWNELNENGEIN